MRTDEAKSIGRFIASALGGLMTALDWMFIKNIFSRIITICAFLVACIGGILLIVAGRYDNQYTTYYSPHKQHSLLEAGHKWLWVAVAIFSLALFNTLMADRREWYRRRYEGSEGQTEESPRGTDPT